MIPDRSTHCAFKPHFQSIKRIVHIVHHCHDVVEGMYFGAIHHFHIVAETLHNCQNRISVVLLGKMNLAALDI